MRLGLGLLLYLVNGASTFLGAFGIFEWNEPAGWVALGVAAALAPCVACLAIHWAEGD